MTKKMFEVESKNQESSYYSFERYNTLVRFLTYWYQITEVLAAKPRSVLEIGKGSGLVNSYLSSLLGSDNVKTLDANLALDPDYHLDISEVHRIQEKFDVLLCARVLHHLPFKDLEITIEKLLAVANKRLVLTLPVDELRIYFSFRITSRPMKTVSFVLPLMVKKFIVKVFALKSGSGLWMLNQDSEKKLSQVMNRLTAKHAVTVAYQIPLDGSHYLIVFDKA